MIRLAVFDCDGTLVDSQHDICAALAQAFAAHGLAAPPRPAMLGIVGLSVPEAMAALHPAGDADAHARLAESYKSAFQTLRAEGQVREPLYEGLADLLATLAAHGWLLGVATGKSDRGLRLCLDRHGLADRFVTLQTADRHPSKPHPAMLLEAMAEAGADPADTVMIGDTGWDMAMARSAGVTAIGVTWGYHAPAQLREAGADHIADTPEALLTLLETTLPGPRRTT